jgi:hypothetical protein
MRGFLIGIIWGAVVAGLAAGLSLAIGVPDEERASAPVAPQQVTEGSAKPEGAAADAEPAAETPEASVTSEDPPEPVAVAEAPKVATTAPRAEPLAEATDAAQPDRLPQSETAVARPAAPVPPVADAEAPDAPAPAEALAVPPQVPVVGAQPAAPDPLPDASDEAQLAVSGDRPVVPAEPLRAPDVPLPDAGPLAETAPADPPAPLAEDPAEPVADQVIEAAPADETPPAVAPDQTPDQTEADQAEATGEAAPEPPAQEGTETTEAEAEAETETETALIVPQTTDQGRPSIGTPAGSLINRPSAVPEGRLPRINDDETEASARPATPAGSLPAAGNVPEASPLRRFAAPARAAEGAPRIAIVLIDDGSSPLGPGILDGFPFAVTIALDPSHPEVSETARAYRAAGFEVMALADVPEGAVPTDVEVALAGALDAVPEAVALLEDPEGGVQKTRAISAQVTSFLVSSGHGLVTQPKGLNTAQQLAAREGVPSATLFRDFDGQGQNTDAMRRFLQNGALRARQEGAVVMLGRLKADTVTALIQWGLQDTNDGLALVPVSVVLREAMVP